MMKSLSCIGIGLSLTVATLSGISINAAPHSSATTKFTPQKFENCSSTSVQICRSQIIDPHTGQVISVSNLKRH